MDEKTLLILRNEINSLDIEIISLLESRLQISKEIGVIKRKIKKDFFDKQRPVSYTHLTLPTICSV